MADDYSHGASALPRSAIERFLGFARLGGNLSDDDDAEEDGVHLHRADTGALPFQALETDRGPIAQQGPAWGPRLREWVLRWRFPLTMAAVAVALVAAAVAGALSLTGGGGGGGGLQRGGARNRVPPWTELPAGASLCPGVAKPFTVAALVGLDPTQPLPAELFAVPRNRRYQVPERAPTPEETATTYNNFYEFTTHKNVAEVMGNNTGMFSPNAGWTVTLDGLVEEPGRNLTLAALLASVGPLEERLYRLRCVEAWSMAIPWVGFPLCRLLDLARPLPSARYVQMESFLRPGDAPGQAQAARGPGPWAWPWPYTEALTMEEARNEMALLAVGSYGQALRPQSGAPLRLVVPWKYGFKSVKSIVRFTFTAERPATFWSRSGPLEYGFWANVNPKAPHKRWSQASERQVPEGQQVPSKLFNGYEEFVGYLYEGMEGEDLYHR